jgi:hypothetical protein
VTPVRHHVQLLTQVTRDTVVNAEPDFVQRLWLHQLAAGQEIEAPRPTEVFAGTGGVRLRLARATAAAPSGAGGVHRRGCTGLVTGDVVHYADMPGWNDVITVRTPPRATSMSSWTSGCSFLFVEP